MKHRNLFGQFVVCFFTVTEGKEDEEAEEAEEERMSATLAQTLT
jgi:hypothetical protein